MDKAPACGKLRGVFTFPARSLPQPMNFNLVFSDLHIESPPNFDYSRFLRTACFPAFSLSIISSPYIICLLLLIAYLPQSSTHLDKTSQPWEYHSKGGKEKERKEEKRRRNHGSSHKRHLERMSFPKYDYQPLEPGYIRVLDLLSQPGQRLRCRLRHVAFDTQPEYVALSYVWGDPEQPFSIEVAGDQDDSIAGFVPLTTNVQHALENLRDCERFRHSRTFWIDQICIDQTHNDEKNHQVARMMHIYKKASEVVTYLGPETPEDEEAIRLLHRIHQFYDDKMETQTDDPRLRDIYSRLEDYYIDPFYHMNEFKTFDAIPSELRFEISAGGADRASYSHLNKAIISGPWSKRIWLVQENVVNRRTGFLRGFHYMEWDSVALACILSWVGILPFMPGIGEVVNMHRLRLRTLENLGYKYQILSTLYGTMQALRRRKCTDTRDKIYAVLGLASDAEDLGIVPEYGKCPAQVFTDVAVKHIHKAIRENGDDELDVLTWVGRQSPPDPLFPSWVPSVISHAYPGQRGPHQHASKSSRPNRLPLEASLSFQSTPSIENAILVAKGIRLEPLASEFGSFNNIHFSSVLDMSRLCHGINVLNSTVARLGDSDEVCSSICQTLIMDSTWPDQPETRMKGAAEAFRDFRRVLDLARDGLRLQDRNYPHLFHIPTSFPEVSELAAYVIKHSHTIAGRALWRTERGGLVLAPESVRLGDVPVVLFGGKWIYFLRPSGDMFEYLGLGYVHGSMNGEVFDADDWQKRVETVRIK